jgi:hypothetical protein
MLSFVYLFYCVCPFEAICEDNYMQYILPTLVKQVTIGFVISLAWLEGTESIMFLFLFLQKVF